MDIIIQNAKLRGKEGTFQIGISEGKITEIGEKVGGTSKKTVDAEGRLVTEAFCNPHLHLCKVYTLQMQDEKALSAYHGGDMGSSMTAIELAARVKEKYDAKWIIENVRKNLNYAALNGNLFIRAFADVDSKAKLEGIKALIQARDEFKGIVNVQVVAFPQDGVVREPGTLELMEESMKLGADVVGGIPWIEFTQEDEDTHINEMMKLAIKYDKDISMLVDDTGCDQQKTTEKLAIATIKSGRIGRSLAHHARAMALYSMPYFKKLSALLKQSGMGVISDPHTGPLHARVKELLAEGNLVALGQDDCADAYYPFGQNNMLEVGFLNVHLLWMTTLKDMEVIYDMITKNGAKCMNIPNYGIEKGKDANLVILDAPSIYQAFHYHKAPWAVISHGALLDKAKLLEKIGE